ncbi:hypothetical protein D3C73_1125250 [compost metagenome]
MPAKRQHRTVEDRLRVGGGLTVTIDTPPFRHRFSCPLMELDLTPCRCTGRHIKDKRWFFFTRPAKRYRVSAKKRLRPASRGNPCMAGRRRQRHQPSLRKRLNIGKQRRKVHAAVNRQCCNTTVARLFHQQRKRALERQQGKCPTGVHLHNGRSGIGDNRLGVG